MRMPPSRWKPPPGNGSLPKGSRRRRARSSALLPFTRREQKEQAMAERFASRFETELNALNEGLQRPAPKNIQTNYGNG